MRFKKIKTLLRQPYPLYYDSWKNIFWIASGLCLTVTLFLFLFQPFPLNFEEHRFSYLTISLFRGILVGIIFGMSAIFMKYFAPYYVQYQKWTTGKELLFISFILLLIGLGNFFIRDFIYDNPDNFSLNYFKAEIINTFLIGFLFASIAVMINYIRLLQSTVRKAKSWDEKIRVSPGKEVPENPRVRITAESQNDEISFNLSDFFYAIVDGNYVEFFLRDESGAIHRHIKRNTLKRVETQLKRYNNISRTHRSYIVNLDKIKSVSGNAQGYKLTLKNTDAAIPVARGYISEFDRALNRSTV